MPSIPPEQQPPYDGGTEFDQFAYSILDVCRKTSIGHTALYDEIKAGRLRAHKAGHRTVILDDDLRAWLASLPVMKSVA